MPSFPDLLARLFLGGIGESSVLNLFWIMRDNFIYESAFEILKIISHNLFIFNPGPDNTHVFMCGSPKMSESMIDILVQDGFKEDTKKESGQIHVEKYWQG